MATAITKMSKWLLISGGALIVTGLIIGLAVGTSSPSGVSAQATPIRTATPAVVATPVRTATPAVVATPVRTATPAVVVRTPTPAAPGALPANGDSVTFPALAIALAGAGLVGLGLFARYSLGKSKA